MPPAQLNLVLKDLRQQTHRSYDGVLIAIGIVMLPFIGLKSGNFHWAYLIPVLPTVALLFWLQRQRQQYRSTIREQIHRGDLMRSLASGPIDFERLKQSILPPFWTLQKRKHPLNTLLGSIEAVGWNLGWFLRPRPMYVPRPYRGLTVVLTAFIVGTLLTGVFSSNSEFIAWTRHTSGERVGTLQGALSAFPLIVLTWIAAAVASFVSAKEDIAADEFASHLKAHLPVPDDSQTSFKGRPSPSSEC